MKTPQLRTLLFIQAGIIFCIPLYLILWECGIRLGIWAFTLTLVGNAIQQHLEKQCKKQLDECAKTTLLTVDSLCFDLAAAGLVLVAAWLIVADSHEYVGVVASIVVFFIYLARAVLFSYWDKKGLS